MTDPVSPTTDTALIARQLASRLRHSVVTAQNDDFTPPQTEPRFRHGARVSAMLDAAEFLEDIANGD